MLLELCKLTNVWVVLIEQFLLLVRMNNDGVCSHMGFLELAWTGNGDMMGYDCS